MDDVAHYKLGIDEMDVQHQYLFKLFDSLERGTTVSNSTAMKNVLAEIERFLNFHLHAEEYLMIIYEFPGFAVHQSDHENAVTKFLQFLDDFDAGRLNPAALRIFLTGWLMEHSRQSDYLYAVYIKKKREEVFNSAVS